MNTTNTIKTNGTTTAQTPQDGLTQCAAFVQQAETAHQATNPPGVLTTKEKQGMLKMPAKGGVRVPGLALLWQQYGGTLQTVDLTKMESQLSHAQTVRAIAVAAKLLVKGLEDDAFTSESAVWTTATQIYTVLQTLSRTDNTLAVALEPYAAYFSEGAKTHKADKKLGLPSKRALTKKVTAAKKAAVATVLAAHTPPVTPTS
jgi:hypothetical protein